MRAYYMQGGGMGDSGLTVVSKGGSSDGKSGDSKSIVSKGGSSDDQSGDAKSSESGPSVSRGETSRGPKLRNWTRRVFKASKNDMVPKNSESADYWIDIASCLEPPVGKLAHNASFEKIMTGGVNITAAGNSTVFLHQLFNLTGNKLQQLLHVFDRDNDAKVTLEELDKGIKFQFNNWRIGNLEKFTTKMHGLRMCHNNEVSYAEFEEIQKCLKLALLCDKKKTELMVQSKSIATGADKEMVLVVIDYNSYDLQCMVASSEEDELIGIGANNVRSPSTLADFKSPVDLKLTADGKDSGGGDGGPWEGGGPLAECGYKSMKISAPKLSRARTEWWQRTLDRGQPSKPSDQMEGGASESDDEPRERQGGLPARNTSTRQRLENQTWSFRMEYMPISGFLFGSRDSNTRVRWVNMPQFNSLAMVMLATKYGLHPLAVEDVFEASNHQPKFDQYEDAKPDSDGKQIKYQNYFAVIPFVRLTRESDRVYKEWEKKVDEQPEEADFPQLLSWELSTVCVFLAGAPHFDTLVSVETDWVPFGSRSGAARRSTGSDKPVDDDGPGVAAPHPLCFGERSLQCFVAPEGSQSRYHDAFRQISVQFSKLRQGNSLHLFFAILKWCMGYYTSLCLKFRYRVEWIQDMMSHERALAKDEIAVIFKDKRDLQRIMILLKPTKAFIRKVKLEFRDQDSDDLVYLEDVEDVVDQAMDDAKEYISLLDGIVQENRSYRDNKMNDILFFLTRVTTIVVPAQFLTGLYGMNFVRPDGTPNMPELEWDYGYVYFWCLVVFLTIVSTIYMSRLQI